MSKTVAHRLSISLPEGHYSALQRLAEEKRVSVAWVVRDAIRAYVESDSPLYNEIRGSDEDHVRTR